MISTALGCRVFFGGFSFRFPFLSFALFRASPLRLALKYPSAAEADGIGTSSDLLHLLEQVLETELICGEPREDELHQILPSNESHSLGATP